MMHSPIAKIICKVSWIITALAAINTGLMPMNYDFFRSEFVMMNLSNAINGMYYIIGIAGVISLLSLIMHCMKGDFCHSGAAGAKGCSRCGSMTGCSCR